MNFEITSYILNNEAFPIRNFITRYVGSKIVAGLLQKDYIWIHKIYGIELIDFGQNMPTRAGVSSTPLSVQTMNSDFLLKIRDNENSSAFAYVESTSVILFSQQFADYQLPRPVSLVVGAAIGTTLSFKDFETDRLLNASNALLKKDVSSFQTLANEMDSMRFPLASIVVAVIKEKE